MNEIDSMLAKAQVGLAFLFAIGFLLILAVLIFYQTNLTPTVTTILTSLLSVFVTILTLQSNYFFARQRPPGLPDSPPTTTTLEQSPGAISTTTGANDEKTIPPIMPGTGP